MTDDTFPDVVLPPSKKRDASEAYLRSKHNLLRQFDNVEDLATDETKLDPKERDGILHHLLELRSAIARRLWTTGIYIGASVLDELVLGAASIGQADICGQVIGGLRRTGAERPGFVLYPLTEFGMEIPPFFSKSDELQPWAAFREANFAVMAQANSFEQAFANLETMAEALGITDPIDRTDIEHHIRAGNMRWFKNNPLLVVRLASHTGDYYENQFVYTLKIRTASAQVVMLHALAIDEGIAVGKFRSSAEVNNWETLDIRHYLIGEATAAAGKSLSIRRVPMNVGALELARLSDLAVTLSTGTLARPDIQALQQRLTPVLRAVEDGYLKYVNLTSEEKLHSRVYGRMVTAIDWYRQSFGSRTRESEAIVALAVAFETLLTDHYAPGGAARLARRVGLCLTGHPRVTDYQASVVAVYHARSEVVHTGDGGRETEIARAQAAFAHCFCEVASRLDRLDRKMVDPIRQLLEDALTQEEVDAKAATKTA